jgi:hypothetical protein
MYMVDNIMFGHSTFPDIRFLRSQPLASGVQNEITLSGRQSPHAQK